MKIVDLSHTISPDMPAYPGTEQPIFKIGRTIENDGFLEKEITLYSHTGTHIDAPAHLIKGLKTLDQLQIEQYFGEAILVDFQNIGRDIIQLDDLTTYEKENNSADFLLINTGWNKLWGTEKYYSGYPVLSIDAADWLSKHSLKGFGIDAISADVTDSTDFPVHKILFKENIINIEDLVNLEKIKTNSFKFSCFPLSIQEADESPVRAIIYLE